MLRLNLGRLFQWSELTRRSGQIHSWPFTRDLLGRTGVRAVICASLHTVSRMKNDYPSLKDCARKVFEAGVQAVLPNQMVKDALQVDQGMLTINQEQYILNHNIHIVAFGKAVLGMVRASEDVLGEHVVGGIASIPVGIQQVLQDMNKVDLLPVQGSKVKLMEGAKDNLPDSASHQAATQIMELADRLTAQDILLVLISGGGSALLPAPPPSISLDEKLQVIRALAHRGASIEQLNTVRKNLSMLKGGKLAERAAPAKVIGLILSDIIGDPLDLIASAPTMPNQSTAQDCLAIFKHFGISEENFPSAIFEHLRSLDAPQQSQSESSNEAHIIANNLIIGSNSIAVHRSCEMAETLGFEVFGISNAIDGEALAAAETFVDIALCVCERYSAALAENKGINEENSKSTRESEKQDKKRDSVQQSGFKPWFNVPEGKIKGLEAVVQKAAAGSKPVCVIGAGETIVTVRGRGRGGRNQELALAASIAMETSPRLREYLKAGFKVVLLSGGTDGQDGPTDAAGALADADQASRAKGCGLNPVAYLGNNDSYTFYKTLGEGEDLLVTGLTGTNVMDIQLLLVYPPN